MVTKTLLQLISLSCKLEKKLAKIFISFSHNLPIYVFTKIMRETQWTVKWSIRHNFFIEFILIQDYDQWLRNPTSKQSNCGYKDFAKLAKFKYRAVKLANTYRIGISPRKLRIWSHLLKKSSMENLFLCSNYFDLTSLKDGLNSFNYP